MGEGVIKTMIRQINSIKAQDLKNKNNGCVDLLITKEDYWRNFMKQNIDIRKVKIGDEDTLAYIQTESWKSAFNRILSKEDLDKYSNVDMAKSLYSELLNENIANGFILSVDKKPHCIAYWDKTRESEIEEDAEIRCIHSLSDNWGKGYGSEMMEYILNDIKNAGFNKVMLWVFEENNRARRFYEKHGFILTEKTKKFSNAIEVMYCKELQGDSRCMYVWTII